MPRKSALKCYFGCETEGPLHQFPKPEYPSLDRFNLWKMVLNEDVKEKGNNYIFNNIRFCDCHFEGFYRSVSKRLTRNAVPTLNISSTSQVIVPVPPISMNEGMQQRELLVAISPERELLPKASTSQSNLTASPIPLDKNLQHKELLPIASTSRSILPVPAIPMDENLHYKELLPKAKSTCSKKCIRECTTFKVKILKLQNKCKSLNQKIRKALKLSQNKIFLKAVEKLPEPAAIFTNMQLRQTSKMPRGRRYTIQEKIMCLTIFKQSQKAYNLLQRLFTLPSKRSLLKILSSISLSPGINDVIIKQLKKTVKKMPTEKKLCTIIFDEVALTPGLYFQKKSDEIVGFEDFGGRKTKKLADHALVFLLKGIKGKYKQPICFTFCQSATKSAELKQLIKKVIEQVDSTGLKVIATICDQSATNMSAINSLINDTRQKYTRAGEEYKSSAFELNDMKVFPLYDPPHLLKGLRNNLLTKNLKYVQNGELKIAKWDHLQMLLDIDVGEDDIRLINKLTESHVNKEKIPKMKVKHAAQVFSQSVSAAMRFSANHKILPEECLATADLLLLVDKLFDSFNACNYQPTAKIYRSALKKKSVHFKLWDEVLPILNSMEFIAEKDGKKKYVKVPSLKNWTHNIYVIKEMFSYMNEKYSVSSLLTRNLNQDPLENFFCNIRSNGVRNVSPTCSQFIGAYKTLLINNLTSPHSIGANCEQDNNKMMRPLSCLINIKTREEPRQDNPLNVDSLVNIFYSDRIEKPSNIASKEAKRYVAGYLVKKSLDKICNKCNKCRLELISTTPPTNNDYIFQRDYTGKSCKYPSEALCSFLDDVCLIIEMQLKEEPHIKDMKYILSEKIKAFCYCGFLSCNLHKLNLFNYLIGLTIDVVVHSWCTNVNRLLKGHITKCDSDDEVKMKAMEYYKKAHHKRK